MEYIVIDTNEWRRTAFLKSQLGQSLIFHMQKTGNKIIMPEVIEKELIDCEITHLSGLCENIQKASDELNLYEIPFEECIYIPDRLSIYDAIKDRLDELGPLLIKVPLSLEHAQSALIMSIEHIAPNSPNKEQFRDSLLWQAIVNFKAIETIHFISHDKAFYHDRIYNNGLNHDLKNMLNDRIIVIHSNLEAYLTSYVTEQYPFDETVLTKDLRNWLDYIVPESITKIKAEKTEFDSIQYYPIPEYHEDQITVSFRAKYSLIFSESNLPNKLPSFVIHIGTVTLSKEDSKLHKAEITEHEEWITDKTGIPVQRFITHYFNKKEDEE